MTMPHERLRALKWGSEFLTEIVANGAIASDLRAKAGDLTLSYPSPEALMELIAGDDPVLPGRWVSPLVEAHQLFVNVRRAAPLDSVDRRYADGVLRHFPDRSEVEGMERAPNLRRWLGVEQDW